VIVYCLIVYYLFSSISISNVLVAWAVWACNRELVSLLLTQPFGMLLFRFYLIRILLFLICQ